MKCDWIAIKRVFIKYIAIWYILVLYLYLYTAFSRVNFFLNMFSLMSVIPKDKIDIRNHDLNSLPKLIEAEWRIYVPAV